MSNSLLVVVALVFGLVSNVHGQQTAPGQWLVRLSPSVSPVNFEDRLEAFVNYNIGQPGDGSGKSSAVKIPYPRWGIVSTTMNIWLLKFEGTELDILAFLLRQPEVLMAQPNHFLSDRANVLPNDPLFDQQWQYINNGSNGGQANADLDAEFAWNITTGGLTVAGDTIVVAVIDGGINKTHPDLMPNLWINRAEIPNDGIDNDNNGYVDDFKGWNVFSQNDNIQGLGTTHGTPVSGIIGAAGNNGTGVTGVNWNVKIMFVAGGNLESDMLAAYDYVLKARKKYNQTNGTAGAFVVAVNCSWGLDYGMPVNAPLWCAAFDELGEAGILSVAATANNPVNVDIVGDLPTTCPSDYLISVTSLDKLDEKAFTAAWGQNSIDLGAYGEGIFTTAAGGQYGTFSGTSFAAPHVAGSIGLLFSSPCPELIAEAKINPKAAAIWAKDLVLGSVSANISMKERTVTEGRLNLSKLLQQYELQCASCPPPFGLKAVPITPYATLLTWSETSGFQSVTLKWRKSGVSGWTVVPNLGTEYLIAGLEPCTNYEVALRSECLNGETSAWSPTREFTTTGCCEAANFNWSATPTSNGLQLTWGILDDFPLYKILFHQLNSATWQIFLSGDATLFIPNLMECTHFEMQIQGWCLDSWVNLTPLTPFDSPGCGACLEKQYCSATAVDATEEWITAVQVGTWLHQSGSGGSGYQNLTLQQASNPQISPQSAVDVVLTPGFWGTGYKEYFRIYVDYNLDGDFNDVGELAFDPGFSQNGVVLGSLISPAFTQTGTTRMRVLMKYADDNQVPPTACGTFNYGQVEDYCIDLVDTQTSAKATFDSTLLLKIYPQPATNYAWIDVTGSSTLQFDLTVWDISGKKKVETTLSPLRNNGIYLDTNGWPSGVYLVSAASEGRIYRGKLLKQ